MCLGIGQQSEQNPKGREEQGRGKQWALQLGLREGMRGKEYYYTHPARRQVEVGLGCLVRSLCIMLYFV